MNEKMKVYELSYCEWFAATDLEQAKACYRLLSDEDPYDPRAEPLTDDELRSKVVCLCENERWEGCTDCVRTQEGHCSKTATFAELLAAYIADDEPPGPFFCTEP